MLYFALAKRMCFAILSEKEKETREKASGYFKLSLVFEKCFEVTNRPFSHSILPLQCVQTIAPERNWGGHFRTFAVLLPIMT